MTSTLVVGNAFGVALAADTATTLGRSRSTDDGARKLIGLPKPHTLGLMHSGSVLVHGVPYSTFIDSWVSTLPQQQFSRVTDYVASFLEFLEESINDHIPRTELLRDYLDDFDSRCRSICHSLKAKKALTPKGLKEHFESELTAYGKKGKRQPRPLAQRVFDELGQGAPGNILQASCIRENGLHPEWLSIEGVLDLVFGKVFDGPSRDSAIEWSRFFLGQYHPTGRGAGMTFSGFGSKELMPVSVEVHIDGVAFGRLFAFEPRVSTASRHSENGGYTLLETMGQSNEIWRLINSIGLAPHYSSRIVRDSLQEMKNAEKAAENKPNEKMPNGGGGVDDKVEDEASSEDRLSLVEAEISTSLAQVEGSNMYRVRGRLAGANLSKLCSIAVRLIQLESLAQDLGGQLLTVGSQVVCGVVTKNEGFYWVDPLTGEPRERRVAS